MTKPLAALCIAMLAGATTNATATEIIYRPINPSFGGDPLNGPVLLNSANAQNRYTDPKASSNAFSQQSPLQQFNDQLQRAILSRIATTVSGGLFDSSGNLIPGIVETSDFKIEIVALGGGVLSITTTDKLTGQTVSFQVSQ